MSSAIRDPDRAAWSPARHAAALLLVAIGLVALVTVAYTHVGAAGPDLRPSGEFSVLAQERPAPAQRPHPLLGTSDAHAWMRVADAGRLDRDGSSLLDDVQQAFGTRRVPPVAVAASPVRPGVVAWASPRSARLVDLVGRRTLGQVTGCGTGIDAMATTESRLFVAGCGRLAAIGPGGGVAWRSDLADGAARSGRSGRPLLLAVEGDVVVALAGSPRISRIDGRSGAVSWERRTAGGVRLVRRSGAEQLVAASSGVEGGVTRSRVQAISLGSGRVQWTRRWRGWTVTAVAGDGSRVVAALAGDVRDGEGCTRSGLAELGGRDGVTRSTRAIDARLAVRDMVVERTTGRLAVTTASRGCTVAYVEPRLDLYGARGLVRLHRVALPARPCSGLAARARLVAVATCDEIVGIDALGGQRSLTSPLPGAPARRSAAIAVTSSRVVATDDVGTLLVLEAGSGDVPLEGRTAGPATRR